MHHVAVGLDLHQLIDHARCRTRRHGRGRCARGRPASRARRAPSRRPAAPPRSGGPPRASRRAGACRRSASSRRAPVDGQQRLGAGSRDLEVAEVEEVHVRAGVDRAQAAVDREWLRPGPGADQRCDGHDLEGVARVDVAHDPRDHPFELLTLHVRLEARHLPARGRRRGLALARHRPGKRRAHLGDRASGRRVGPLDVRLGVEVALTRIVMVCFRWSKIDKQVRAASAPCPGGRLDPGWARPSGSTVRTRS